MALMETADILTSQQTQLDTGLRLRKCENRLDCVASWTSRYRRIYPGDEFFKDGDVLCQLHSSSKQTCIATTGKPSCDRFLSFLCHHPNCNKMFSTVLAYEMHYTTLHRYTCTECRRSYPTQHLLDIHLQENHNVLFEQQSSQKPMFCCLVESCREVFQTSRQRLDHVIVKHKFPANFRFLNCKASKKKQQKRNDVPSSPTTPMVESDPIDNSDLRQESNDSWAVVVNSRTEPAAAAADAMDTDITLTKPARRFAPRIPETICFGHGAARTFSNSSWKKAISTGSTKTKKKHWHQSDCFAQNGAEISDTTINIEEISTSVLSEALS